MGGLRACASLLSRIIRSPSSPVDCWPIVIAIIGHRAVHDCLYRLGVCRTCYIASHTPADVFQQVSVTIQADGAVSSGASRTTSNRVFFISAAFRCLLGAARRVVDFSARACVRAPTLRLSFAPFHPRKFFFRSQNRTVAVSCFRTLNRRFISTVTAIRRPRDRQSALSPEMHATANHGVGSPTTHCISTDI